MSFYQGLKLEVFNIIDLSKDAIHIHIGLSIFIVAVILWKKGRIEIACLLPVAGIACLMEILDLYDDYNSLGFLRWSASIHDIINTVAWPVIFTGFAKIRAIGKN